MEPVRGSAKNSSAGFCDDFCDSGLPVPGTGTGAGEGLREGLGIRSQDNTNSFLQETEIDLFGFSFVWRAGVVGGGVI